MNTLEAARRWAGVWVRAWPAKDAEAIVSLYADSAEYRALRVPRSRGRPPGVRRYLEHNVAVEHDIECRFSEPFAGGDRAAVEWWASWNESGADLTMAGVTILRFDDDGMVIDHRDYWNQSDRREQPFNGW